MKLLLIEPANQLLIQSRKKQIFENLIKKNYFIVPPLALGIPAGLTPEDWEVKILQEPGDVIDFDQQADLVGLSAVTHTAKRGCEIAQQFRMHGKKVIMEGILTRER